MKFGKTLIKREERVNSIFKYKNLFKEIPCLDLIEVSIIEACCAGVKTKCQVRRTRDKIPKIMEISDGPVIRSVTSLDYSRKTTQTYPTIYTK